MLKPIVDNVWCAESSLDFPRLPLRMTVVRLVNGDLWIHSPVKMDQTLVTEIKALGEVKHIIAPNLFHNLFVEEAKKHFPGAQLYAAPGLEDRRRDIFWDQHLTRTAPPAWSNDFEQHLIEGASSINEVVFFHKASRTLITTDMVFNLQSPPSGFMSRLFLTIFGTYKHFAMSRLWVWKADDKKAVANSVREILKWDIDRVLMTHGDIVGPGAKPALEEAVARFTAHY